MSSTSVIVSGEVPLNRREIQYTLGILTVHPNLGRFARLPSGQRFLDEVPFVTLSHFVPFTLRVGVHSMRLYICRHLHPHFHPQTLGVGSSSFAPISPSSRPTASRIDVRACRELRDAREPRSAAPFRGARSAPAAPCCLRAPVRLEVKGMRGEGRDRTKGVPNKPVDELS